MWFVYKWIFTILLSITEFSVLIPHAHPWPEGVVYFKRIFSLFHLSFLSSSSACFSLASPDNFSPPAFILTQECTFDKLQPARCFLCKQLFAYSSLGTIQCCLKLLSRAIQGGGGGGEGKNLHCTNMFFPSSSPTQGGGGRCCLPLSSASLSVL